MFAANPENHAGCLLDFANHSHYHSGMPPSDSLSTLFRACHRELVRRAARLLGCHDRAEDVAQDAYAGLLGRLATNPVVEPRAYLFVAARNLAIDRLRHSATAAPDSSFSLAEMADPNPSAEARLASRQRLALLAAALNELPEASRTAFLLARLEGLPHRVIAARLGVSVSMVEKHIMRAMAHARARLPADTTSD